MAPAQPMPVTGRRRQRDAGLSLVELMITMIIASMVATTTFMFFVGQQRVYDTETKVLNIQQNIWAAIETVSRYVRAAGTGMAGCVEQPSGAVAGDPPPVGAGTGWAQAPAAGLRAYNPTTGGVVRVPPVWIVNGGVNSSTPDSLTIAYGDGTFGNWVDVNLASAVNQPQSATIQVPGAFGAPGENMFRVGEFFLLLDRLAVPTFIAGTNDRGCTLFQVSALVTGASDEIRRQNGVSTPWNPPADAQGSAPIPMIPAGSSYTATNGGVRNFGTLRWYRFAINAAANPPTLTMEDLVNNPGNPQVLAQGIEDMQIAYGCDLNRNGVIDEGTTAATRATDEWFLNTTSAETQPTPPATCNQPNAIRITLMARSTTTDSAFQGALTGNAKAVAEDQQDMVAPAVDDFRHRTITTTVYLRNWGI